MSVNLLINLLQVSHMIDCVIIHFKRVNATYIFQIRTKNTLQNHICFKLHAFHYLKLSVAASQSCRNNNN